MLQFGFSVKQMLRQGLREFRMCVREAHGLRTVRGGRISRWRD